MKKIRTLSILNLLFVLTHIMFAYASQVRLAGAKSVGEISDQYNSLFTPAGFTFGIWGVIYTALLISCIYHIIIAFGKDVLHEANKDVEKMGALLVLNNLGAVAWLVAWTNNMIGLALILIVVQLVSLISIHLSLAIRKTGKSWTGAWFTEIPLTIYFSWITIATIANVATYLVFAGWDGWGVSAINWTVIMITVAIVLTAVVIISRKSPVYGLVTMWALYGIISKRRIENAELYNPVIAVAWVGIGVILIVCSFQLLRNLFPGGKHRLKSRENLFPLAHHSLK